MSEDTTLVQIKGLRDGLLVTLGEGAWEVLQTALVAHVDERPAFFKGARMALDVGSQVLHVTELVALRDLLSDRGISLWAVLSEAPATEKTAQLLGLATRVTRQRAEDMLRSSAEPAGESGVLWLDRTVRSGTRVEFPGKVVVLGDINPGAEIVAGGSVLVWGHLRGVVHAGAHGDVSAVVCALDLSPTQLRIADVIAVPSGQKEGQFPEIASLKDGHVSAEPWQPA